LIGKLWALDLEPWALETTADSSLVPQFPIHSSGGAGKRRRGSNCCGSGCGVAGDGADGGGGGGGVRQDQIFMLRLLPPFCFSRNSFQLTRSLLNAIFNRFFWFCFSSYSTIYFFIALLFFFFNLIYLFINIIIVF